jgi:hypothetical protein
VEGALELPTDAGLGIELDPSKFDARRELAFGD